MATKGLASRKFSYVHVPEDGAKGDRGPALRGPMYWVDCPVNFQFQCGGKNDDYIDIVVYNDAWYMCQSSHLKTSSNPPGSTADNAQHLWVAAAKLPFVAVRLLLAQYALIENLGAEAIEMKDTNGNIIFEAKGGNVTCNKGNFKDVTISGHLTASTMDMRVSTSGEGAIPNGSLCFDTSSIKLPALEPGIVRSIKVYNPFRTRSGPSNLELIPENTTVRISTDGRFDSTTAGTKTIAQYGANGGVYLELLGVNVLGGTTWTVNVLTS